MDDSNNPGGAAFAYLFATPFIVGIVYWLLCAVTAGVVAPRGRETTFVLITLFFLGPIGIAAAAVAQPRNQM